MKLMKCKCGGKPEGMFWQIHDPEYWVSCSRCDNSTPSYTTKSGAIESWNADFRLWGGVRKNKKNKKNRKGK